MKVDENITWTICLFYTLIIKRIIVTKISITVWASFYFNILSHIFAYIDAFPNKSTTSFKKCNTGIYNKNDCYPKYFLHLIRYYLLVAINETHVVPTGGSSPCSPMLRGAISLDKVLFCIAGRLASHLWITIADISPREQSLFVDPRQSKQFKAATKDEIKHYLFLLISIKKRILPLLAKAAKAKNVIIVRIIAVMRYSVYRYVRTNIIQTSILYKESP